MTQDHLDFHKTFENYLEAKCKLFEQVSEPDQTKSGKGAIINIDDAYGHRVVEKLKHLSLPIVLMGTAH